MSRADRTVLEADEFDLLIRNVAKHLQGTEQDHDQSTHAGGRGQAVQAEGGRMSVTQVTDTTFRYEYGDYVMTTNITGRNLLEDALEGMYFDVDRPPSSIEELGEVALDLQWNRWEGNFAMRHMSAAMMGLDHPYAGGGEEFEVAFAEAVAYGDRPDDPEMAQAVEDFLSAHAATTHAMVQAVADNHREFAEDWEGVVRRGMVVTVNEFGESSLHRLRAGDTLDMPLSGFSPNVNLVDDFLRGGDKSREYMQSDDDFVFAPTWSSVMFEFDTTGARTLLPANWQELAASPEYYVHTSYEDRAADRDDGENFRKVPAPHEVVTQGKFRVTGVRDVERQFRHVWAESDRSPENEDMRVITIQQTAVYNPRTGKYDALPGFVTLPDGRVVPVEEA